MAKHPLFLALSASGTGKSRLLQEFLTLAQRVCDDGELKACLKNAYVFHVTFENSTAFVPGKTNIRAEIGGRMYFQLHKSLAVVEKKQLCEMTVVILVDGLQQLPMDDKKQSLFYGALWFWW